MADCKIQWGQTAHTSDLRLGTTSLTQTANRTQASYNRRFQDNVAAMRHCLRVAPQTIDQDTHPPQHTPSDPCPATAESPLSESTITMGFTVAPLVVGVWGEVNDSVLQVLDDAAEAGLDQFFPTVVTVSQKVARAQLRALMARRLGVAMTAARADAYLRVLAERGDPHALLPPCGPACSTTRATCPEATSGPLHHGAGRKCRCTTEFQCDRSHSDCRYMSLSNQ